MTFSIFTSGSIFFIFCPCHVDRGERDGEEEERGELELEESGKGNWKQYLKHDHKPCDKYK